MGADDDATNQMMQEIQTANDISTHFLTCYGSNGDAFKVTVKKVEQVSVMAKHSDEWINMIAEATIMDQCGRQWVPSIIQVMMYFWV